VYQKGQDGIDVRAILFVCLCLVTVNVPLADLTNTSEKLYVPSDPGIPDGRECGDRVSCAITIPALPYNDSGNTSGTGDDYDEVCPYMDSTSPDRVFYFYPTMDMTIDISLCDSNFDTKLYVYENTVDSGAPYACNDDTVCGSLYQSALYGLSITCGNIYYIVVDGYNGDMGDYSLTVTTEQQNEYYCELDCPLDGIPEDEPVLEDEYVDTSNGGCNSDPAVTQAVTSRVLCGTSGYYSFQGSHYRDTDWFSVVADGVGRITVNCSSENPMKLYVLLPLNCDSVEEIHEVSCNCSNSNIVEFNLGAGNEVGLWLGPVLFVGQKHEFDYVLSIDGIEYTDPDPIDNCSWGKLKRHFSNYQ
jgi:hypothetical protein